MRSLSALAGGVIVSVGLSTAQAAAEGDPAACAKIENSVERLACFDRVFQPAPPKALPTSSKWVVTEETSKIDDSKNVFMVLDASEPMRGRYGDSVTALLFIACREGTTSAWVDFAGFFMSDHQGGGRVTYRIDGEKAQKINMAVSSDNEALGLWDGGSAIPWLRKLFGHDRLLIRAMPYNESELTVEFPISGLEEAAKPLRAACGWPDKS
ncbi:type VI secretion system-associated protein TagO [Zavarzinia aquatilis]|nr:type VI secretion system-associated protein TagO [Zavarzinia aquatilis]